LRLVNVLSKVREMRAAVASATVEASANPPADVPIQATLTDAPDAPPPPDPKQDDDSNAPLVQLSLF
jgi:hypothetical protein